jgi:hypothetical protein
VDHVYFSKPTFPLYFTCIEFDSCSIGIWPDTKARLPVIATGIKDPTAEDCLSENFTPKELAFLLSSEVPRLCHIIVFL